ncbi:MAG: 4-hydroxy-tetrahydrodipicolinate reductase [Nitrososphaerota archaeon]|nr:4-hydroxy-tetrahydrodipicolinate reductase [Nitrososphaerota archaeon]
MVDTDRIKLAVVGATGRMGGTIVREAPADRFEIVGAVAAEGEPGVGRSLRELGLTDSDIRVVPPKSLADVLDRSDVCISFTSAAAELANLPTVVAAGRPLVLGTTGFNESQESWVVDSITGRIPVVMTSNFSVGANFLFAMASSLKNLPPSFDTSILEMHHSGKADAPSGTAKTLGRIVSESRGYSKTVNGRSGISKRTPEELEIVSLRGGGMPGEHTVFAFGPHETLKLEHVALSRSTFSQGALLAAEWISRARESKVYSMLDVLGFRH